MEDVGHLLGNCASSFIFQMFGDRGWAMIVVTAHVT